MYASSYMNRCWSKLEQLMQPEHRGGRNLLQSSDWLALVGLHRAAHAGREDASLLVCDSIAHCSSVSVATATGYSYIFFCLQRTVRALQLQGICLCSYGGIVYGLQGLLAMLVLLTQAVQ